MTNKQFRSAALTLIFLMAAIESDCYFVVKNNRIYDQDGGTRIFHGVNMVAKNPPYFYKNITEKDLQGLKSKGINGIRLGVMWPGVEPKRDVYNETYIQLMVDFVNLAGSYDIFTLVEFHQDLFSEKFCADGVPVWAIEPSVYESFPEPLTKTRASWDNNTGLPLDACKKFPWAKYYFTYSVNKAFGNLWHNRNGLLTKFGDYWKKVATAFRDNPYVIAYQLMNEPWPGDMYENPVVMAPDFSQKIHLQQAYDYISKQIRSVDSNHNICYEPVTWLNQFQSGFTHPPGGFRYSSSSVFCYHFYSPPTKNLQNFMNARVKDTKRLKSAGILSEFMIIGERGEESVPVMDICDKYSHSWFGWQYDKSKMIKQIRRTFAHRVAGDIVEQLYNHTTKRYLLKYAANRDAKNTLIFYDREDIYKEGAHIECSPSCKYSLDPTYLIIDSAQFQPNMSVMVTIDKL